MTKNFILALDQGTTSSRAILFDREGVIHGSCNEEFPQIYPRPGWVEHDPEAIWRTQCATANRVLHDAGCRPPTSRDRHHNQRETTVVMDRKTGEPHPQRHRMAMPGTADLCEQLDASGLTGLFRDRTGLVLDAYFSGTKVKWLLDRVPRRARACAKGELCFGPSMRGCSTDLPAVTPPTPATRPAPPP